jgi:hypothetical protein
MGEQWPTRRHAWAVCTSKFGVGTVTRIRPSWNHSSAHAAAVIVCLIPCSFRRPQAVCSPHPYRFRSICPRDASRRAFHPCTRDVQPACRSSHLVWSVVRGCDDRGAAGAGRAVGVVPAGGTTRPDPAAGRRPAPARRPRGIGSDHPRGHLRLHLAAVAVGVLRPVRGHGPPAVHRVDPGAGVRQAPPPGPGRTRRPRRAGPAPLRDRLGEHAGAEKRGSRSARIEVDRGTYGSKIHLVTDRSGLPLSVGISGADTHDSQALVPLVKGIPPIHSRRGRRRGRRAVRRAER